MAWRSSTLAYRERHCPAALDHHEAGTPRDREVFQVGIAAHAILDVLCRRQVELGRGVEGDEAAALAQAAAEVLVREGREFDGTPEPPMSPAASAEGRELAVRAWYVYPTQLEDRSEHGLAVDVDWRPVDYSSPRAWWKAAMDIVGPCVGDTRDDEDDGGIGVCVTDYKSAWPTDETELETIQIRGQALVAVAHAERLLGFSPAFVRRRVINLRTLASFEADLVLDEDGEQTLSTWRQDVRLLVAAAESRVGGKRPARPGAHCLGCPFLGRCEDARAHLRGDVLDGDPETIATRYAVVDAMRDMLRDACVALTAEGPVVLDDGVVGHVGRPRRVLVPTAAADLCRAWWKGDEPDPRAVGLVTALEPSVTAAGKVAAALYPRDRSKGAKADRDALIDSLTISRIVARFGIHPTSTE